MVTCWKAPGLTELLCECQKMIQSRGSIVPMPVVEKWNDGSVMRSCMELTGFQHVDLEEVEFMLGAENNDGTNYRAVEMMKGIIEDHWSEEEKDKLPAAIEALSNAQKEYFFMEQNGLKGVRLAAWVAKAQK